LFNLQIKKLFLNAPNATSSASLLSQNVILKCCTLYRKNNS
jgi:hypothetical protein